MLIGYIAIIALLNGLVSGAFSLLSGGAIKWDFQTLIGFVFAPLAFLAGVPWEDAVKSGSVMATKLLSNEFVAMQSLGNLKDISEHERCNVCILSIIRKLQFNRYYLRCH